MRKNGIESVCQRGVSIGTLLKLGLQIVRMLHALEQALVQEVDVAAARVKDGRDLERDVGEVLELVPAGGLQQAGGLVEGRVVQRRLHRARVVEDEDDLEALEQLHALGVLQAYLVLLNDALVKGFAVLLVRSCSESQKTKMSG